jgi:hypothetical protein
MVHQLEERHFHADMAALDQIQLRQGAYFSCHSHQAMQAQGIGGSVPIIRSTVHNQSPNGESRRGRHLRFDPTGAGAGLGV